MAKERVNGVELFYETQGEAGPPLVLVHGSWGDHHNWDGVVPALARSCRVLTYDRRGHSQSERPSGSSGMRDDVTDLAALMEATGFAPAHVIGNSGGATVVLRLAAARPALFRSLVVHEPALAKLLVAEPTHAPMIARVVERIERVATLLSSGDVEAGARSFVNEIAMGPGAWDALPSAIKDTFLFNAPTFLDECRDPDDSTMDLAALAGFGGPALLTQGNQSPAMFPAIVDILAKALPSAARHTFDGAGHVPHVSHPDAYVRLVSEFVRGVEASAKKT